ncbi:MAG TPA: hypothetical protein VM009_01825 [Terriglobales bacterium]|nr:hypothetical protein [Terriglobales bacterium]
MSQILMIEKSESKRIRVEIRRVLIDVWDPIGIKGIPQASGEYDDYLADIMELLANERPDEEIAKHLLEIVTVRMGLTAASLEDMFPAARALRAISLT